MIDSIWDILPYRLFNSCDSSMRALLKASVPEFSTLSDTGKIRLTLFTRSEKVALRLARRSQSLLNRLRRLAGDNCEVVVVHDIAPGGEEAYLIQLESAQERNGYYTGFFILAGVSQFEVDESAT